MWTPDFIEKWAVSLVWWEMVEVTPRKTKTWNLKKYLGDPRGVGKEETSTKKHVDSGGYQDPW